MPTQFSNFVDTVIEAVNEAIVTVGEIAADDFSALYQDIGSSSIFPETILDNRYTKSNSTYMLGVSSPDGFKGNSAAFVQLHAPTLLWIADWTVSKWGDQPEIPSPVPSDPNWILLSGEGLETANVTVGPDGISPVYRVSGTYVFGHKNPSATMVKDILFGRPPWLTDSITRTMPDSKLTPGLIDVAGSQAGSTSAQPGVPPLPPD